MPISKIKSSAIDPNAITGSAIADGTVTSADLDTNIDIAGTLDVTGNLTADSDVIVSSGTPLIQLKDTDAVAGTSSGAHMEMFDGSDVRTGWVGHGSTTNTSVLVYSYHDNVKIAADRNNEGTNSKIEFEVDGTEVASIHPAGLSFDSGANALGDYEEGTFDITITAGGSAWYDVTHRYVKIGHAVFITGRSGDHTSTTNATGALAITTTLPFTPNHTGWLNWNGNMRGIAAADRGTGPFTMVFNSSGNVSLMQYDEGYNGDSLIGGGGGGNINRDDTVTAHYSGFSGVYYTNS